MTTTTHHPRQADDHRTPDQKAAQQPLRMLAWEVALIVAVFVGYQTGVIPVFATLALVLATPALTFTVLRSNKHMAKALRAAFILVTAASVALGVFLFTQPDESTAQTPSYTTTDPYSDTVDPGSGPADEPVVNGGDVSQPEAPPVEAPPAELTLDDRIAEWAAYVAPTYTGDFAPAKPTVDLESDLILGWVNTMLQDPLTANGVVGDLSSPFYPDGVGGYAYVELGGTWEDGDTATDRYYTGTVWLVGAANAETLTVHYQFHPAPDPVGGTWLVELVD